MNEKTISMEEVLEETDLGTSGVYTAVYNTASTYGSTSGSTNDSGSGSTDDAGSGTVDDPPVTEEPPVYLVDLLTGVQTFSYAADGDKYLSKNFKVGEFRCNDGTDEILIDMDLVKHLQKIRDWAEAPITITSGYRTPAHNDSTPGSAKGSLHLQGKAADFVCSSKSPLQLAQCAETIGVLGIEWGINQYGGQWTHIDTRIYKWYVKCVNNVYTDVSSFYDLSEE